MTTQQKKIIDQLMRLEVLFDKVAILLSRNRKIWSF